MYRQKIILLTIISFLMSCTEQPTKSVIVVPVEERSIPVNTDVVHNKGSNEASQQRESVIIALLNKADTFASNGQSDRAAATIERALRIEPKNAFLWHRLAVVRMQQQQWQQAIAMARKSNTLAKNNNKLKSENRGVIAIAYDKLGKK